MDRPTLWNVSLKAEPGIRNEDGVDISNTETDIDLPNIKIECLERSKKLYQTDPRAIDKVFVTRSARTTSVQYALLVNTMIAKPAIASGRFPSPHGKKYLAVFWSELAEMLNNAGPRKTIIQWQKVWTTLKSNTRVKVAKRRRERLQTGKTTTRTILTELEKKVVGLMCRAPVEELFVQQANPNDEIPLVPLMSVEEGEPDCNIKTEELMTETFLSGGEFGEHSESVNSPSPPPQNMPRIPQASTQRPRFVPVQNASRTSVFQKSVDLQQDVALKLAEAQTSTTKMINEMGEFFMEERMRDREERIRESEERMREREESMREREERMREREERMRESEERFREMGRDREERMKEKERDREERVRERDDMMRERKRDREERRQQHAQYMLLLKRRKM